MTDVYLGLGSNLAEPISQISCALAALQRLPESEVKHCSSLYGSIPMGPQDQPDYVNAVVGIQTQLSPLELLKATQKIELEQGRERKEQRWGPRSLDIDILLFGEQIIQSDNLIVPHYGMKKREFVLYPLHEIMPELRLPDGELLKDLIRQCPLNNLKILSSAPRF